MDNFNELAPSIEERASAQQQLPYVIQELLNDKQAVAKNAAAQFSAWDTDKTGDLSQLEFDSVYQSRTASLEDRATAGIFLQNLQEARNLASPEPFEDSKQGAASLQGYLHIRSVFGENSEKAGVTQKDISVLSLLTSESNRQSFITDAKNSEDLGVALDGLNTLGFGGAAVIGLTRLLTSPKASIISGIGFVVGSLGLSFTLPGFVEKLNGNQLDPAIAEYSRRQEMLSSWQAPGK